MPLLILDGDAKGAVKAMAEVEKVAKRTGETFDLAAIKAKALGQAAEKIIRDNEGPQERYNRKVKELGELLDKGKLSHDQAATAVGRYRNELDRATKSSNSLFDMSKLTQWGASLFSVTSLISSLRAEMDRIREEGQKTTQTHLTAADARDVLKRNIFGLPDAERSNVLARADTLAGSTKLPQAVIDQALAQTISARGGNAKEAIQFVEFAARFTRDQQSLGEFSGALGDIANALGTKDPEAALGFLGISAQQARPTDLRQIARNLPKITQAVRGAGGDPRYGSALFAGISVGAADPEGDISRTAGIRLIQRVDEFFKGNTQGLLADQVDTFDERLSVLLHDKNLAKQMLDKSTFEAGAQPAIQSLLLDPNSAARISFNAAYAALGDTDRQRIAGGRGVEFLASGGLTLERRAEETVQSRMEQLRLSRDAEFSPERRAEIRELVRGVTGTPTHLNNYSFWEHTGSTLSLQEAIGELQYALRNRAGRFSLLGDRDAVPAAEKLLAELKEVAELQRRELSEINRKTRSNPAPTGRQEK